MLTFGVVINHFDLMWSILDEKEVGMFIIINLCFGEQSFNHLDTQK